MRLFFGLIFLILPISASAQTRDSVFPDYAAYAQFVDSKIMSRDFIPLVQNLGGRDEYTKEQLAQTNLQLLQAFPQDFQDAAVFRRVDLGNGFWQEARAYWTQDGYAYYYAFLHQRADDLIVLKFNLNSSSQPIMDKF